MKGRKESLTDAMVCNIQDHLVLIKTEPHLERLLSICLIYFLLFNDSLVHNDELMLDLLSLR